MVEFKNVKYSLFWIYAEGYDCDFKVKGKVLVHRYIDRCYVKVKGGRDSQFMKASWVLVDYVNKGCVKQNGAKTICWG